MSSPNESGWLTPMVLFGAAALVLYGISRGSGNCPLIPVKPQPTAELVAPTQSPSSEDGGARLLSADESTFDRDVLKAEGAVLVDFYADWCGPCQRLAPVLERVSEDLTEGRIVKVDVDQNPGLAARYDIRSIPTLLVFVDGEVVERSMGVHSEDELRGLLQREG